MIMLKLSVSTVDQDAIMFIAILIPSLIIMGQFGIWGICASEGGFIWRGAKQMEKINTQM